MRWLILVLTLSWVAAHHADVSSLERGIGNRLVVHHVAADIKALVLLLKEINLTSESG